MSSIKLKTIIADQEKRYSAIIQEILVDHEHVEIIKVFDNFEEATSYLLTHSWDLLILYIPIPTLDCKFSEVNTTLAPQTILITDTPEFAVNSYDLDGPDYILAPFTKERLLHSISKYLSYYQKKDKSELERLIGNIQVNLKTGNTIVRIRVNDILYLEGNREYIKVHLLNDNPILVYGTFDDLINIFPKGLFVRCHRSYSVNRKNLCEIKLRGCTMIDGSKIPISATYKRLVKFID